MRARIDEKLLRKWEQAEQRPAAGQVLLWDNLLAGFGCRVTPKRPIAFVIQYRVPGSPGSESRKVRRTLRHWPECKVEEARKLARKELGLVAERDVDGSAMPLREAVRVWFERVSPDWRPRYTKKVDRIIAMYLEGIESERVTLTATAKAAVAHLGSRPISTVRRTEVMRVVNAISRGTGEQFMAVLSSFFNWASECEWIDSGKNPARNRLRVTGGRRERIRSLNDVEMVRLWRTFEAEGDPHFGAFQMLVLTGARRREVTGMEWREVDLEAGTWTLPAERRKTGRKDPEPFVIALAPLALDIIRRQPRLEGSPHVFWGRRDRRPFEFHNALIDRVRKAAGIAEWRLHDIRRTARSGMGRLGISQAVAEMCLGHLSAKGGLVKIYDQHSYESEKREAWLKWAEHVDALTRG